MLIIEILKKSIYLPGQRYGGDQDILKFGISVESSTMGFGVTGLSTSAKCVIIRIQFGYST